MNFNHLHKYVILEIIQYFGISQLRSMNLLLNKKIVLSLMCAKMYLQIYKIIETYIAQNKSLILTIMTLD
jgi:hypothetical protein